jgi:hypothetical protein
MTRLAGLQREIRDKQLGENVDAKELIASPPPRCQELSSRRVCTAYGLQLSEFLTCEYSMLRKYLGDLRFHEMAQGFIAANPSNEPNARWYACHLPSYLKTARQFIDQPEIAEIAQLENALNAAFDGPEAPVVTMAEVAAIDPADFGNARFEMAPTLHRFSVSTNVSSLWASLKCGVNPPVPENFREPAEIMVWRQGSGARFRILGKEEAIAVDCACQSLPYKVICEVIAAFDEGEDAAVRAAGYLRGWLEAEIISSIRIDGEVEK